MGELILPGGLDGSQATFLIILVTALVLFVRGRPRIDVTAMLVLLSLTFTGLLEPQEALSGFISEPAIIVASVFVMAAALSATGVTDRIGHLISTAAGRSETRAILVLMPAVALLAAFSHHLMVTAMMLPIVMRFARDYQIPASRLLMPMSLAASLGTTLTLFSAPAFLLAGDMLRRQTGEGLDIFDITPIGAALVVTGVLCILLMRWVIPRRTGTSEQYYLRLEQYFTELLVKPNSPWIGKSLADFCAANPSDLLVVDRLRNGVRVTPRDSPLAAGDVLLVRASPEDLKSFKEQPGLALNAIAKYGEEGGGGRSGELVQVVVGPRSEFAARSIGDVDFFRTLGVVVVGLWRRQSFIVKELSAVRLEEGDVLVISGTPERLEMLARHTGFLMMVPFDAKQKWRHRSRMAVGILLGVVALAALDVAPAHIIFLAGAVAMVLAGCVSVEQGYREIDVRIFVMIAGVIPLGSAMESTGMATLFATQLTALTQGWDELSLLIAMFVAGALLTQILSDAATTVLIGPIAIAMATAIGRPPAPFVVCVALGAVASFLTPIGHHGNLLILHPGRYTFGDFLRIGVPLTVLLCLVSAWIARALWLEGPWLPGSL
ncbi:MAG TPA: SLC13 family permease [Steroidobacteraceae bacterium]|nr:SLC13 family permease [Steroidobacteraceae bacterium]